jgi:cytochrome c2
MRWARDSAAITGIVVVVLLLGAANYVRDQQKKSSRAIQMTRGDPSRAPSAIRQYGCGACHAIAGVQSPGGVAGPPLSGIADRLYVGGAVENTPDNLIRWIVNPKQFSSRTAMPVTGINESEARDVAAFLYSR